jgi:hypothetical protein
MPVEVAIACHDDVLELLVALGADVNLPTKQAKLHRQSPSYHRSLLDWVRFAIQSTSNDISRKQSVKAKSEGPAVSAWKGYHADLVRANEIVKEKQSASTKNKDQVLLELTETKDHFVDVERLLVSRHAKTWDEIYPDEKSTAIQSSTPSTVAAFEEKSRYVRLTQGYGRDFVPQHIWPLYDELYEACFTGNNEKVRQLCLPTDGTKTQKHPLQISVQMTHPTNEWMNTGK